MLEYLLWFTASFVFIAMISSFLDAVEALYGNRGLVIALLALLVIVFIDHFYFDYPGLETNDAEFMAYMVGMLAGFIFSGVYVEPRIKERLQVDGEPRFR